MVAPARRQLMAGVLAGARTAGREQPPEPELELGLTKAVGSAPEPEPEAELLKLPRLEQLEE